ncbi:hypothetical protein EBZ37_02005 [bacterium]|nr:hypothetical protein [bacterium]
MRFVLLASLVFTPSFLGCVPQNRVHGPSAVSKVSFFPDPVSQSTPSPTHPSAEAATGVQFSSRPASAHSAASEPVSSDSVYEKSIPVLISFGQISGYFSAEWARALSGYVRSSNCEQVGAREYRCGEFPVGQVVSDSSKLLMSIPIPAQSGKEDGVSYSTASATIIT